MKKLISICLNNLKNFLNYLKNPRGIKLTELTNYKY